MGNRTRRWGAGVTLIVMMGGCGNSMVAEQASEQPSASAGSSWYSVAGGVPEISGAVLVTTGPMAAQNGFDDDGQFQRVWSYTGSVLSASVDINRADPGSSKLDSLRWGESVSRDAGHIVVPLSGVGDGGLAIAPHQQKDQNHPLVRAEACSGNATVSVLMTVDGAITTEADLTAHAPELIATLDQVLADLRPR